MSSLATELKTAWRQDLKTVQSDVATLQIRMQTLEDSQTSLKSLISSIQTASATRDALHHSLITQLDDQENRSRRNNIRLRGIPESVHPQDLINSLTKLFNSILGKDPDDKIEFDRAHRALRPQTE